jgi:hypothetical protein
MWADKIPTSDMLYFFIVLNQSKLKTLDMRKTHLRMLWGSFVCSYNV